VTHNGPFTALSPPSSRNHEVVMRYSAFYLLPSAACRHLFQRGNHGKADIGREACTRRRAADQADVGDKGSVSFSDSTVSCILLILRVSTHAFRAAYCAHEGRNFTGSIGSLRPGGQTLQHQI